MSEYELDVRVHLGQGYGPGATAHLGIYDDAPPQTQTAPAPFVPSIVSYAGGWSGAGTGFGGGSFSLWTEAGETLERVSPDAEWITPLRGVVTQPQISIPKSKRRSGKKAEQTSWVYADPKRAYPIAKEPRLKLKLAALPESPKLRELRSEVELLKEKLIADEARWSARLAEEAQANRYARALEDAERRFAGATEALSAEPLPVAGEPHAADAPSKSWSRWEVLAFIGLVGVAGFVVAVILDRRSSRV
jgi:hypothetical protein